MSCGALGAQQLDQLGCLRHKQGLGVPRGGGRCVVVKRFGRGNQEEHASILSWPNTDIFAPRLFAQRQPASH
jgi:hypothetical protein